MAALTTANFVNLVDEYDAGLLHRFERFAANVFFIDHFVGFFIDQQTHGFFDLHFLFAGLTFADIGEHGANLIGHFFHARRAHDVKLCAALRDINFDFGFVQVTFAQFFAEFLSRHAVLIGA